MGVHLSYFCGKLVCRDPVFWDLGAHVSHKGAAREKWGSWVRGQGVHLNLNWWRFLVIFSPRCVFEGCFFTMCHQKGFKCFRAGFFPAPWSANMRKCGKIIVGSFKNRVGENTKKRRHGISWELPMWRYGHFLRLFWQAILRKSQKRTVPEKHVFWRMSKCSSGGL